MQNAHLRLGRLEYVRHTEGTNTHMWLHVDRYVGDGTGAPSECLRRRLRGRRDSRGHLRKAFIHCDVPERNEQNGTAWT
jgi:hypothetical protein